MDHTEIGNAGIILDERMVARIASLAKLSSDLAWSLTQPKDEVFKPIHNSAWAEMELVDHSTKTTYAKLRAEAAFSIATDKTAWIATDSGMKYSEVNDIIWQSTQLKGKPLNSEGTILSGPRLTVRITYVDSYDSAAPQVLSSAGSKHPCLPSSTDRSFKNWEQNMWIRQAWTDKFIYASESKQAVVNGLFTAIDKTIEPLRAHEPASAPQFMTAHRDLDWNRIRKTVLVTQQLSLVAEPISSSADSGGAAESSNIDSNDEGQKDGHGDLKMKALTATIEETVFALPTLWAKPDEAIECQFELADLVDFNKIKKPANASLKNMVHLRVESVISVKAAQKPLIYLLGKERGDGAYCWISASGSCQLSVVELFQALNLAEHEIVADLTEEQKTELREILPDGIHVTYVDGNIGLANGIDDLVIFLQNGRASVAYANKLLKEPGNTARQAMEAAEAQRNTLRFGNFYVQYQGGNPFSEVLQQAEETAKERTE